MQYTNPVLPGFYPDPSVCRVGSDFYLVTSTFEWFPGVPIFHSEDLIHWSQIGHCLTRKEQLNLEGIKSSGGIYAPTIRYHEGLFYMVTTNTTGIGNFFVTATDPAGEWSNPIPVAQGGIDPSLFWDSDGRAYFVSNSLLEGDLEQGIYLREIDTETGRLLGRGPTFLWKGTGGKFPEAPHLYRRGDWYYLLIAEGGTELTHRVSIARSRNVFGPYESYEENPILSHAGSMHPVQSTGHGDLVEDSAGNWWIVFLGVRHVGYPLVHHLGRETYLAPVSWNEKGWPIVNDEEYVDLKMTVDRPLRSYSGPETPVRDKFLNDTLRLCWNFRRNLSGEAWSVDPRAGELSLHCLPGNLDGTDETALIARRLQHFEARVELEFEFSPKANGEEAGLVAVMNEKHHCEILVTLRNHESVLLFRKRCGSLVNEYQVEIPVSRTNRLRLSAKEETLYFYAIPEGGNPIQAGMMETRLLSTEVAGGFTGLYVGMYASSNGNKSHNNAIFHWFDYEPAGGPREWDRSFVSTEQTLNHSDDENSLLFQPSSMS